MNDPLERSTGVSNPLVLIQTMIERGGDPEQLGKMLDLYERWTANEMKKVFPDARRHLEYQDSEALGRDIANSGDYLIQCKRGRRYASLSAIKEIQICPIEGGIPVLITRGDNTEALACLPFTHFLKLIKHSVLVRFVNWLPMEL